MEKNKKKEKKNKMSLDKKTKNYISITLYQSKICRNSTFRNRKNNKNINNIS